VVSNVPSYGENTVAEHTMALLLMLSRKVHQSVLQVRSGRVNLAELTGFDLQGKTIWRDRAGHIGLHVIRIARGFGMRVLACDVRSEPFLADLLGFTYATMNQQRPRFIREICARPTRCCVFSVRRAMQRHDVASASS